MPASDSHPVTRALEAITAGNPEAARELLPLVYDELRSLARARLRHLPPGQTLQPTALVHEAYMRVVGGRDPGWDGRGHFFGAAAQAMRRILVTEARRKAAIKRGGDLSRVDYEQAEPAWEPPSEDIVAVDEALRKLEEIDPRKGRIVDCLYFAGLTAEETAAALGISVSTIRRDWRYVRTWLARELQQDPASEAGGPGGRDS